MHKLYYFSVCFYFIISVSPKIKGCTGQWTRFPWLRIWSWVYTHWAAFCGLYCFCFCGTVIGWALTCQSQAMRMLESSSQAQGGPWCPVAVAVLEQSAVHDPSCPGVIQLVPLFPWKQWKTMSRDGATSPQSWVMPCSLPRHLQKPRSCTQPCRSTPNATVGWAWAAFIRASVSRYASKWTVRVVPQWFKISRACIAAEFFVKVVSQMPH